MLHLVRSLLVAPLIFHFPFLPKNTNHKNRQKGDDHDDGVTILPAITCVSVATHSNYAFGMQVQVLLMGSSPLVRSRDMVLVTL